VPVSQDKLPIRPVSSKPIEIISAAVTIRLDADMGTDRLVEIALALGTPA